MSTNMGHNKFFELFDMELWFVNSQIGNRIRSYEFHFMYLQIIQTTRYPIGSIYQQPHSFELKK